jgi:sulfite exporter TauE/SafE
VTGAFTMLAFGLGTAVALFAVGMASSMAGSRLGRWSNRVAAASIMVAGGVLLWRGLAAPHCHG